MEIFFYLLIGIAVWTICFGIPFYISKENLVDEAKETFAWCLLIWPLVVVVLLVGIIVLLFEVCFDSK